MKAKALYMYGLRPYDDWSMNSKITGYIRNKCLFVKKVQYRYLWRQNLQLFIGQKLLSVFSESFLITVIKSFDTKRSPNWKNTHSEDTDKGLNNLA